MKVRCWMRIPIPNEEYGYERKVLGEEKEWEWKVREAL